jgi:hypothetical protein
MAMPVGRQCGGSGWTAARASLLGAALLAGFLGGCVKTTRRVLPTTESILARHDVQVKLAPGWHLTESPMHFRDTSELRMTSPDGMAVFLEVTRSAVPDLEKRVEQACDGYRKRYPSGRFHLVKATVGVYPAQGFDGTVVLPGESGRRVNVFFRCFDASGRHVSVQGQAPAAVWAIRRADLQAILASLRVGPGPEQGAR